MSLRRLSRHATFHYALYAAAGLLALLLAWLAAATGFALHPMPAADYSVRRCQFVDGAADGPVLEVLDAVYMEEMTPVDDWCQLPALARHFGAVEIRSVHRDDVDLRDLYSARYQLVLAKPELMARGRKGGAGSEYQRIARYPEYGSQLVSLQGMPQLSRQWLAGKRLGLLDDPNSISGYQIPKSALRNAGLEDAPEIVLFRSYRQLYSAFFDGEIDVIPALLSQEGADSALQLPPGLVLEERIAGPGWYLAQTELDTALHCDLAAALEQLAARAEVDFLRGLVTERPCALK